MSTAMPQDRSHREIARACLDGAKTALNEAPIGAIGADVLMAHSTKAQVFASAAIAHALLEIGDVLRAAVQETNGE